MAPGVAGIPAFTTTAIVRVVLVPQALVAVTEILPLTAPAPMESVIEFVVEVPVQPEGKVQV